MVTKNFKIKDSQLYYMANDKIVQNEIVERLVVTRDKVGNILRLCHDSSGHQGVNKTVQKISQRYYWKGIVADTKKYIKFYELCQKQNKKAKTAVPELSCVPVGQRVWGKIGIDLIGPFLDGTKQPLSSNGYR